MPAALPSAKKVRVITTFKRNPLMNKEAIAEMCGLSIATTYRIIRSYKKQSRYRRYAHLNSLSARKANMTHQFKPS